MLKISQKIKDKIRGKITKKRNKQEQDQQGQLNYQQNQDQLQENNHHNYNHSHLNNVDNLYSSLQRSDLNLSSVEEDAMTTATTDTRRRVKLYALNAERQWDDRGTGHVSSSYVDRLKGISLLVRAESDGSLLLESKIQPDTAYQKQQDTLIVWSEGDNFDLALSFQEKIGCDEIWEKICQVQGKDPSVDITQDIVEESEDERFEDMSDTAPPVELPPCELSRLEDIAETIQNSLTTQVRKEKLALALESENYIKKLLSLFRMCEDLENTEGLHYLFDIFKNIFLLNKNALFEIMFAEDTIFDVVGCLEFDPNLQQPKKHRQYLKQLAKFREAVPIRNPDLLAKIHQTYRVQYIQDIILPTPSVFVEDNMLNTLSSFIFFNKVEIVTLIQEDEKYLIELFSLLTDPNTPDAKRRDTVLFLKEFCNYAQNLQPQGKDAFYKTLTCLGILQALEITLVMNDQKTKSASIDILTAIVEYSPSIVRNYTLQQMNKTDGDQMLINIAIEQMLSDSEPELGGAVQLMGVIRILLDPENMLTEKTDFLNLFYKYSIQTLVAPLLSNTVGDTPQNENYQTAQLLGLVLEILSFCVEHHSYHIKSYIIQKDLLKRILVLMKSNHTFLVLGALRLLRKIIHIKDEFYNRHIVKGNLFAPVVDAFVRNRGRYNLLESAILELFDFIKIEDIKSLCVYFVENFSKEFDSVEYVHTFKYLKSKYDQFQDRLKERDKISDTGSSFPFSMQIIRNSRYRRDQRQLEEEEESWFNEEEDFSEELDSYSVMKSKTEKNGKLTHTQSMSQTSPPHQNQTSSSAAPVEHPLHHFQQQIQQNHHLTQNQQQQSQQNKSEDEIKDNVRSGEELEVDDKNSLSSSSSSNDSSSCENSRSSPPPPEPTESLTSVSSTNTNTTIDSQIPLSPKHHSEEPLETPVEPNVSDSNATVALNESERMDTSEKNLEVDATKTVIDPKPDDQQTENDGTETQKEDLQESIKRNDADSESSLSPKIEENVANTSDVEQKADEIDVPAAETNITPSDSIDNTNTVNEVSSNNVHENENSLNDVSPPLTPASTTNTDSSSTNSDGSKGDNGEIKKGVLKGLVDYEGDSDDEEDDDESSPKEKKARLE